MVPDDFHLELSLGGRVIFPCFSLAIGGLSPIIIMTTFGRAEIFCLQVYPNIILELHLLATLKLLVPNDHLFGG